MNEEQEELTCSEAGRRGGKATLKRLGRDHFVRMGAKGGETTKAKRGPDYYTELGRLGGLATRRRHGYKFYEEIGKKGGRRVAELIYRAQMLEEEEAEVAAAWDAALLEKAQREAGEK